MTLLFLFLIYFSSCYSQSVIVRVSQDFESGALSEGWRRSQNPSSLGWEVGTPTALSSSSFRIPSRSGNICVDNDDACGVSCDGSVDFLDSPPIVAGDNSLGEHFVQFDSFFTGQYGQVATLMFSINGTFGPYRTLAQISGSPAWTNLNYQIPFVPPGSSLAIRFWSNDGGVWAGGWAVDNIIIGQYDWTGIVPPCANLLSPSNGDNVVADVVTFSWQAQNGTIRFPYGYYLHFGTDYPPSNIRNHTDVRRAVSFNSPILQMGQTYYLEILPYGKDYLLAIDCPIWNFTASLPAPPINRVPFFDNFETSNGGWSAGGNLSSWAYGSIQKPGITGGHSGSNAWTTGGLSGQYNNREKSFVQSPDFDFSNATSDMYVGFWVYFSTETSYDGAKLQYTLNGGIDWNDLGSNNDSNWYNDFEISGLPALADGWTGHSNGWVHVFHQLPSEINGALRVVFRLFFGSDVSTVDYGFAFDDFTIDFVPTTAPLCAVNSYPINGDTDLASQLNLIWQKNPNEQGLLPKGYYLSFGTDNPPSNIINQTDLATTTSLETPEMLSGVTYFWRILPYGVQGITASDCPVWNFTVTKAQIQFPYFQDFENGEGGWAPLGAISDWAFGSPNKTSIQGCGSGTNCWVTGGLSTQYSNNENSYILSPLFNFTDFLHDPFVRMKLIWETESNFDGSNLQYLAPDGTWLTVGTTVDGDNWYSSNNVRSRPGDSLLGWSGSGTTGSHGWVVASNELIGTAGITTKLRITFRSDNSLVKDGFAFDDFEVIPAPVGITPQCVGLIYPPNGLSGVAVDARFNLQWGDNSTILGLPRGFYFKIGTTNPPTSSIDLGIVGAFPIGNITLTKGTTYYWQVIPYGYDHIQANACPIWSFSTVSSPVTTSPPSSTQTSIQTSMQTSSITRPSTQTSLPSTQITFYPQTTDTPDKISSSGSAPTKGAVAAAVIIPILAFIFLVVVGIFACNKYKKNRLMRAKLDAAERELEEKTPQEI